jgi:hypothetical protein
MYHCFSPQRRGERRDLIFSKVERSRVQRSGLNNPQTAHVKKILFSSRRTTAGLNPEPIKFGFILCVLRVSSDLSGRSSQSEVRSPAERDASSGGEAKGTVNGGDIAYENDYSLCHV